MAKIIVFAQDDNLRKKLARCFREFRVNYCALEGAARQLSATMAAFQRPPTNPPTPESPDVCLLSLEKSAAGHFAPLKLEMESAAFALSARLCDAVTDVVPRLQYVVML